MTDASRGQDQPRLTRAAVLAVLGLAVSFSVTGVDPLLVTLNLAEISRGTGVPAGQVGFLGGAATLVVAAAVLGMGGLGDRYGLKRLLLGGLTGTIAANLLAVLSPGYPYLLVMRLLDGLALAALLGLTLALLTVAVPGRLRARAIGIFMAADTVLYGVTPLIGGWVAGTLGWRWLFAVAPVIAAAGLVLTARYVPAAPRRPGGSLDLAGIVLVGLTLTGLVYGTGQIPDGISRPRAWVPLGCCALALAAFIWQERRAPDPALDLALFRRGAFTVALLAICTVNLLTAGFSVVLGQFGGDVLALSEQQIGMLYLPGTLLVAAASILAGRFVAARTARPVLVAGLLISVAGGLVMAAAAGPAMAVWLLVSATWLCNLGSFVTATPVSDTVLGCAPPGRAGAVAATNPAFGMTGYALGPTVYILLLNVFFQQQWLANAHSRGLSVKTAQHAVNAVTSSLVHSPGSGKYDPNLVQQAAGLALGTDFSNGVRLTMLVATVLPAGMAVLAWFLMPRRTRNRPGGGE